MVPVSAAGSRITDWRLSPSALCPQDFRHLEQLYQKWASHSASHSASPGASSENLEAGNLLSVPLGLTWDHVFGHTLPAHIFKHAEAVHLLSPLSPAFLCFTAEFIFPPLWSSSLTPSGFIWTLNFTLLMYMSATVWIIVTLWWIFKLGHVNPLNFFSPDNTDLAIWGLLHLHINFRIIFFKFCKNSRWYFDWDCTQCIDQFGEYWHLNGISLLVYSMKWLYLFWCFNFLSIML